jgi:hypothetical protein
LIYIVFDLFHHGSYDLRGCRLEDRKGGVSLSCRHGDLRPRSDLRHGHCRYGC